MQQTENYKLNLIETSDPFSPNPLNENAEKTEAALEAQDTRIIHLENCRIVVGQYRATGGERIIDLGERPAAVIVSYYATNLAYTTVVVGDMVAYGPHYAALKIVDNGFWIADIFARGSMEGYSYVALLGDWPTRDFPRPET